MTQMLTILWKDVRGLRWELGGWLALNVAFAVTWPALAATGEGQRYWIFPFLAGTPLLLVVAGALLAVRIVQADALVGTTAAWRTRPLSRLSWLAAKMLLVLTAVVAIPSLAEGLLALALGMSFRDAALAALLAVAWWIPWAAGGMAIAAVTPSFPRAVLTSIAIAAAAALFRSQVSPTLARLALPLGSSVSIGYSQALAAALVLVAGSLFVVVYQALGFRVVRSRVLAAAVLLGSLAVADAWPWDVRGAMESWGDVAVDPAVLDPANITIGLEAGPGREYSGYPHRGSPDIVTKAADLVVADGVPDEVWVEPSRAASTFRSAFDDTLTFDGWPTSLGTVPSARRDGSSPRVGPLSLALGGAALVGGLRSPGLSWMRAVILTQAPEPTYARLATAPGALSATIRLRAYRYRIASRAPVRQSVRLRGSGLSAEVLDLAFTPDEGVRLFLREARILRRIDQGPARPVPVLALLNAERRQALVAMLDSSAGPWLRPDWPSGALFDVGAAFVWYRSGWLGLDGRWRAGLERDRIDQGWLDGAELVLLEPEYLGTFTKRLEVSHYRLPRARPSGAGPR